ncbi:unnamed protein product [Prunus armeniaca]|uniref:Uncharacterized protein n=1 Tax=Prunus armeniaca TaxID=36596 RepID=A0A6J5UIV8_PRUAR|nr:unnamed protein product [Prunus armeniaca]
MAPKRPSLLDEPPTASSLEEEDKDMMVKPISSKPMEEKLKTKKPISKASTTTMPKARAGSKRPSESDPKDSKRPKKKIPDQD